jgi:hypothetical protein
LLLAVLPLGGAGATSAKPGFISPQAHGWVFIHLHLDADDHWGTCSNNSASNSEPSWRDRYAHCTGLAELGEFHGHSIVAHSTPAGFSWEPGTMKVQTRDLAGRELKLEGTRPDDFNTFTVTSSTIDGKNYVTGTTGSRASAGGPLAVNLSSHVYSRGLRIDQVGFSLNVQGWVRLK